MLTLLPVNDFRRSRPICQMCCREFETVELLVAHVDTAHAPRFVCPQERCSFTTSHASNFATHLVTHSEWVVDGHDEESTEDVELICEFCEESFESLIDLEWHSKICTYKSYSVKCGIPECDTSTKSALIMITRFVTTSAWDADRFSC